MMCLLQTSRKKAVGHRIRGWNAALMIPDILTVLLHLISKMGRDEIMLLHVKLRATNGVCAEAPSLDMMHFSVNASCQKIKNLLLVPGRTQYFLVYCVSNHKNGSLSPMTTDIGHTRSSSLWNKSDWTWFCWVIHPQRGMGGITVTLCNLPCWWIAFRLLSWKMSIMVNMQLNCLLCAAHTAKVRGCFHSPLGCSS